MRAFASQGTSSYDEDKRCACVLLTVSRFEQVDLNDMPFII